MKPLTDTTSEWVCMLSEVGGAYQAISKGQLQLRGREHSTAIPASGDEEGLKKDEAKELQSISTLVFASFSK